MKALYLLTALTAAVVLANAQAGSGSKGVAFVNAQVQAVSNSPIEGKWEAASTRIELNIDGDKLSGTITADGKDFAIEEGKVLDAGTITFAWTANFPDGNSIRRVVTGKISGDTLTLSTKGTIARDGTEFDESLSLKRAA
jgi:hypothetical protein